MTRRLLFMLVSLAALAGSGCASVARDMLAEHQCLREASNRPDSLQRKAECQQRMATLPDPGSQRPDS